MATWTNIPDSNIEPGKPIRSIDGLALRDNPIAIAEGASGAPRIQTAGIQDSAVTTAKIADANVITAKLAAGERMTTANVLGQTAGASVGAVGTYAFLRPNNTTVYNPGNTLAGSNLRYNGALTSSAELFSNVFDKGTPSGTWRCMGGRDVRNEAGTQRSFAATVWLRIS